MVCAARGVSKGGTFCHLRSGAQQRRRVREMFQDLQGKITENNGKIMGKSLENRMENLGKICENRMKT
jgi:hypothetical protein